jgi:DNA helicase II / ATP-dependent DNA helicase PcrA
MPLKWNDLSPNQQQIIENISGPSLVIAGPGTGKTEIMAHKIAYLKRKAGISEKEIMSITFSRKASNEMRDRLSSFDGINEKLIRITTLHSLALNTLYRLNCGRKYVASTDETIFIMKDAVEDVFGKNIDINQASKYLNIINSFKTNGISYYQIINSKEIKKIYQRYEDLLKINNVQDLEGIILRTVILLKSLKFNLPTPKYLLVDEFQDINKTEFEFIKQLAQKSHHLFVVGDDDQSIYGWRGSEPDLIINFDKLFKNAKIDNLQTTYRVPEHILAGALSVVKKINQRMKKIINAHKKAGEKIKIVISSDDTSESDWISTEISKLIDNGFQAKNIVILAKELSLLDKIKIKFEDTGIPYIYWGEKNLFTDKKIQVLIAVLRILTDKGDNLAIRTCLSEMNSFNIGPQKIKRLRETAEQNQKTLWTILVDAEKFEHTKTWNRDYKKFVDFILRLQNISATKNVNDVVLEIGNLMGINKDQPFLEFVRFFKKKRITQPIDLVTSYADEKAFNSERHKNVEESEKVNLMSVHSSKGLGFKIVFMLGMNRGIFPNPEQNEDEQRRLCYVGMTRSKQILYMCHCKEMIGQAAHGHKKCYPSEFLQEFSRDSYELIRP